MSVFKNLVNIWKSEDSLSQAWSSSNEMLVISHDMFNDSINALRSGEKNKVIKSIKQRDEIINQYHREIRKKVVTYYSVSKDILNIEGEYSSIKIYNILGELVLSAESQKRIDISTLSNGIFNIHILSKEGFLVKQISITK